MALTGDQIEAITRTTVDLYRTAERSILEVVTRRLAAGMDAPDWAVTRLGALAELRRAVERVLTVVADEGTGRIREALADAYRSGQGAATIGLPARLFPRDPDVVGAARGAQVVPRVDVVESLAAALVADVGAKYSNVLRHVEDVYRGVIQQATAVSVAGGMTRRQASQHAYARFVDQGVTSFTDSRGRQWRLSSYVEMAVRTVTQRAAVQGQTDRLTTLGVDTVIVSDSPRECPRCRPWEGKVLSISGRLGRGRVELASAVGSGTVAVDIAGTVEEARAAGLQHPNCTHSLRAYLPGVTLRPDRPTANPKGYEAKERQREIERQIRKWKERELAALDPAGKATAAAKVKAWQAEMRRHLAANPELKRLPYREQPGAGNIRSRPTGGSPSPAAAQAVPESAQPPAALPLPRRTRISTPPQRVDDLAGMLRVDLDHAVSRHMVRDLMSEIIGGDYAGLTVGVTDVIGYDSFGKDGNLLGLIVRGKIFNNSGREVGVVQRAFYRDDDGQLVAVHAYLQLDRSTRGKGFATEFNGQLEHWYRSQGITRIEVHANIDVGGYTWASHGYDFADAESAEDVLDLLRSAMDDMAEEAAELLSKAEKASAGKAAELRRQADILDREVGEARDIVERAEFEPFGSDRYPSAWEISQCGRSAAGGSSDWLGKRAMLGSDWQGVKWL